MATKVIKESNREVVDLTDASKNLLNYLKDQGVISKYSYEKAGRDGLMPGISRPEGVFSFKDRSIRLKSPGKVQFSSMEKPYSGWFGDTPYHEAVHALQTGILPSRTAEIMKTLADNLVSDKEVVLPSHWERGEIDNALVDYKNTGQNIYEKADRWRAIKGIESVIKQARESQAKAVLESIPEGVSISGLERGTKISNEPNYSSRMEAGAYYLTSPEIAEPDKRYKQYGRFLRDYNIPWPIVEDIMKELKLNRK